ncbi:MULTISPECIES: prepilin peptidase [Streptomyces]|uniref:prepilin peptidase n=1 Tax=Streptomyces TaxID=1883 RepID=UPI00163CA2E6
MPLRGRGLGSGDAKLAFALGAVLGWYGWPIVLIGTFAGHLFGALYGIGLVESIAAGEPAMVQRCCQSRCNSR